MTGDITTNDSFAFGDDDGDDAFQIKKCLSEKKNIYTQSLIEPKLGFYFLREINFSRKFS